MITDWQYTELEEKLGQGVKLAQMLLDNPDDCSCWDKLKEWAMEHRSYVVGSYDEPEAKGFDITRLD
jgi:hypothetical protein